jgi:hypothetical protein
MKTMIKNLLHILIGIVLLLQSACQTKEPACQYATGTPRYMTALPSEDSPTESINPPPAPVEMEIGGRTIPVDKVVEGPLCNGDWSGTVYVTCNVQVYPWVEQPTFLKNCNLVIEPATIVYVAYHNDTAYYNGCSCHTGEIAGP